MNINWSKITKTVLGIGAIAVSAISLLSNLNKSEIEKDNLPSSATKPKEYRGYVPSGCRACGGPYPRCRDGCPVFDD